MFGYPSYCEDLVPHDILYTNKVCWIQYQAILASISIYLRRKHRLALISTWNWCLCISIVEEYSPVFFDRKYRCFGFNSNIKIFKVVTIGDHNRIRHLLTVETDVYHSWITDTNVHPFCLNFLFFSSLK